MTKKNKNVSENTDKNFSDIEKYKQVVGDSGIIDSGFLSGDITDDINAASDTDDFDEKMIATIEDKSSKKNNNQDIENNKIDDEMRIDSGYHDTIIINSMSQLDIEKDDLNPLDSGIYKKKYTYTEPILNNLKIEDESEQKSIESWKNQSNLFDLNDDGDTQLHIAIIQRLENEAFTLISLAPFSQLLDIKNYDGQTPLQLAVLTNQLKIIRRLILAGADPEIRNINGDTALHLAVRYDNIDAAKALTKLIEPFEHLNHSKIKPSLPQNLEQRNYQGQNCLHLATEKNSVQMVSLLVGLGADVNSIEWLSGKSPLHLAIEGGHDQLVLYLLNECKPYIEALTYSGMTAYQIACHKNLNIAKQLVKYGAQVNSSFIYDSDDSDDSDIDDEDENSDMIQDNSLVSDFRKSQPRLVAFT